MSLQRDSYPDTLDTATAVDADGRAIVVDPVVATSAATVVAPAVASPTVTPAPVVEHAVVQPQAAHQTVATSYGRRYAVDSVVVGLVGLAFLVIGLIAVTRAGIDGSMKDPVVEVLGFTHTATLGIIEAGIGLCLLLCAATMSRGASVFFGLVLGVGGFLGAVQVDSFKSSLALETGLAWLAVVAAVIVVAASLLIPRMVTRTNRLETI